MMKCKKCGTLYMLDHRIRPARWARIGYAACFGEVMTVEEMRAVQGIPRDEFGMEAVFPTGSVWRYKDELYGVSIFMPDNLIQYNGAWRPVVRYTNHPAGPLEFYRADLEFNAKFERVS